MPEHKPNYIWLRCERCQKKQLAECCSRDDMIILSSPETRTLRKRNETLQSELNQKSFVPQPLSPSSELLTENQQLTLNLNLKNRELNDLQAQIRALHTQLTERENNSPFQIKIIKLEAKLNLIKLKLSQWTKLLHK